MESVSISRDVLILIRVLDFFCFGGWVFLFVLFFMFGFVFFKIWSVEKGKPSFFTNCHYTQQEIINAII